MPNRILQAARDLAVERGVLCVTREAIAERVGVSATQVSRLAAHHLGEMGLPRIMSATLEQAVADRDLFYIARCVQARLPVPGELAQAAREAHPDLCNELDCPPYGHIWRATYQLVRESGFPAATREAIASRAAVSKSLVSYVYGTLDEMPGRMIACGIVDGDAKMVARGLQIEHPVALSAPQALRDAAAAILANK